MRLERAISTISRAAVWLVVAAAGVAPVAVRAEAPPLVRGAVDEANRVTLHGNVHPLAQAKYDRGVVDDGFAADRLQLQLKRSAQQERDLEQFLEDAHTPGSASYHKWVTPEEFGKRFGAADSDIATVTAWLQSHGFQVNKVHPGRTSIEFSGTAGQLRSTFHTEIHHYVSRNADGYANSKDPEIPAAFAALVSGISPMNSFHAQPMIKIGGKTSYNKKTHEAKPEWTYPEPYYAPPYNDELAPGDFAVQYDVQSVYAGGTNGAGQTIGLLSVSNIDLSLVNAYRKLFSLSANTPRVVIDGNDPGENNAATEAYLDVEEAGGIAPGANVILYASNGSVLTDPLQTSGLRAVDDNQVTVISMSYGTCEAALGASGNQAYLNLWQEAAAQGITAFVSAGDGGSAGCDDFDTEGYAVSGLAVNGMGSTPYNVSVGGLDFYYSDYGNTLGTLENQISTYWGATTDNPAVSLKSYAPEQVWNGAFGYNGLDGGSYSYLVDNYGSNIVAGSGGASAAAVYPTSGPATGYPKPSWQTGTGVPSDKVRDLPDVSLYAANGWNFAYYPICANPGDCVDIDSNNDAVYLTSVGGTSASSPAMAGIQALVNQAMKSSQGQADYVYYALANKTATANTFHDITVGGNEVPCNQGTSNCKLGSSGQTAGAYALTGYAATKGYDLASGLGSVDVANLIKNWPTVSFKPTKTTLTLPATFAHGSTVTVKSTVAPASGSGTPTGSVLLNSNDLQVESNGLDVFSLSGGAVSASVNNLPGGTYQITAKYSGDGSYSSSVSAPVTVTVTPETDTLTASVWTVNPFDNQLYSLSPGESIPYGSYVYVDVQPTGTNEAKSTLTLNSPATGSISFTDKSGSTTKTASVALNSQGVAEWQPASLAVGSHTIGATYAGDLSYKASSNASAATIDVYKGSTSMYIYPEDSHVSAGGNVTVDVVLYSSYFPLVGTLPSGNVTVTLGGQTVTAPWKSWGTTGAATEEAVVTFTKVPEGLLALTGSYAGDANWLGTSATYGTVFATGKLTTPVVTISANKSSYLPTDIVTMTGTVTAPAGKPAPSGYLYFPWEDGNYYYYWTLHQGTNSSTVTFTFPANELANGANIFVANFHGDSNYSAATSTPLVLTLNGSDYSVTTSTPEVPVAIGKSGTGSVTVSPINAYSGTVSVACSAPTGITCKVTTASPTVGTGVSDTLTFSVASTVKAGNYPAVVTVTGGGHTHTAEILVAAH
jgi:hypothetical protein